MNPPTATTDAPLDPAAVSAVDVSDQFADTLAIGDHLRDAMWKAESAGLGTWDSRGGLVVAGMGGSAVGGILARAALADQAGRPILSAKGYELPPWTTDDTTVLCASYSGNTEETLACFEAAGVIGARRVVVTSGGELGRVAREEGVPVIPVAGGLQPRAAVGYMVVAVLEAAAACGAGPSLRTELDVAADALDELAREWGPSGAEDGEAKALARALHGTVPVITGTGLTTPVAYRWKCQINENAERPAFWGELPEVDHNEIVGWGGAASVGKLSAVLLEDCDAHPRLVRRAELTAELIAAQAAGVHRVRSRGETAVERVLSLVLLGDLVSLYMAVLAGVDPAPVAVIEQLKARLAEDA
ncbi:bifunctional phosphoglucose/phosphomannose isomerase [Patulibacter defluvii]|uniref:bifunctional phosphoglucose/phosphomannose isomerase n=1 Tax=Patulibacter defluvii TaxID=3095358 RepID=UPI002A757E57|nr:bifunctional phosphoglucose/phosphomannose isomerase [Patulibacter sp. DM4]